MSDASGIMYVTLADAGVLPEGQFSLDPGIPLPVDTGPESQRPEALTWEGIVAGILRVLGADPDHEHAEYYRRLVRSVRPEVTQELTEAGIIKAHNGDLDVARDIFAALAGLEPANARMQTNLALIYQQLASRERRHDPDKADEMEEQAVVQFRKALEMDDAPPETWLNAGLFFSEIQSWDSALDYLRTFLDIGDDEDQLREAEKLVRRIERQSLLDEHFKAAYDFIRLGQEDRGIEEINAFLIANPDVWNAWFLLGWAHRRRGRFAEARDAFRRSLELDPQQTDTHNELALCLMELGELDEADAALRKALVIEPESVKIISNLAILAMKRGDHDEAEAFARTAAEFDPDDPVVVRLIEELEA